MNALAVVLSLLSLQDPEIGGLRWPFGSGKDSFPLLTTYGQYLGSTEEEGTLHFGLDVLASVKGEAVHAIEAGTVVRVQKTGIDTSTDPACGDLVGDQHCGLVIESDSVKGRALLYLHLEETSIVPEVGQRVAAGDLLGQVLYHDVNTGNEHLHLTRIEGDWLGKCWHEVERLSVCNPQRLLAREALGDAEPPRFVKLGGYSLEHRFRTNEDEPSYPKSGTWKAGDALDLVVRCYDLDGSGSKRRLAPYKISMEISSPGDVKETREIVFDGPLVGSSGPLLPGEAYSVDDKYHSKGIASGTGTLNRFYLLPTNAGPKGLDPAQSWSATSGHHDFAIKVFDLANNEDGFTFSLDIP